MAQRCWRLGGHSDSLALPCCAVRLRSGLLPGMINDGHLEDGREVHDGASLDSREPAHHNLTFADEGICPGVEDQLVALSLEDALDCDAAGAADGHRAMNDDDAGNPGHRLEYRGQRGRR